jgi:hypothetical protein
MKFSTVFFGGKHYPARPSLFDLAIIAEPAVRRLALVELHRLLDAGLAGVYVPAAADFWNVWLEAPIAPPHGQRIRLDEWAQQFATQHPAGQPGGGAA